MKNIKTGYPSIDKPWLKYYSEDSITAPLPECTMYEYIYDLNQNNFDSVAINYYGTELTYGELFDKISLVAGAFERLGVKEGDTVTVCMINSPETIETLFALNKIGAVANMIYGISTEDDIEKYIRDTNTSIVVTLDIFQDKFIELSKRVPLEKIVVASQTASMEDAEKSVAEQNLGLVYIPIFSDDKFISWEDFIAGARSSDTVCRNSESAALITYTGGTTGGSKGVILSNKAVVAVTWQYCKLNVPMKKDGVWALVLPLFIVYGAVASLLIPLSVGMKVVVRIPMAEPIAYICKKFKPNYIMYGPAYWEAFADDNEPLDLSYFVDPVTGGDLLSANVEYKINNYLLKRGSSCKIMNVYGMSEASGAISANIPTANEFGSVGIPLAKNIVSVFDVETGKELTYGQKGEVCIYTPSAMMGYLNNPEETNAMIRKHDDGLSWIHTGDLGYINEDGFVYISGRLKRFMLCIANGVQKKVYSLDIEKVLISYHKISKCAVVPVPDKKVNEAPVAFIILKQEYMGDKNIEAELRAYCDKNLQDVYRPIHYIFVDKFPLTKIGKVDYITLTKLAQSAD